MGCKLEPSDWAASHSYLKYSILVSQRWLPKFFSEQFQSWVARYKQTKILEYSLFALKWTELQKNQPRI